MSRHALGPWKWRSTDARNITEEDGWVAIPKEDYRRLQKSLKGINPEAVPDLLEAAKNIADNPSPAWILRKIARDAIAKAEK